MTLLARISLRLGQAPEWQRRNSVKLGLTSSRILRSISFRISATCWLVTLLTLALYVTVNLPQQKKDLRDALKSKAQGVSSSLQEVTAGAAMSADYSTVVDHCVQVLKGDEAIEYLVITKADGFSVVVDRNGWRTETLDRFWRPVSREVVGEIAYVPLVGKRVFRYARPLDYSAIQWGWVNVGLSTAAYDRSVARVHERSHCWPFSAPASVCWSRSAKPGGWSGRLSLCKASSGRLRAEISRLGRNYGAGMKWRTSPVPSIAWPTPSWIATASWKACALPPSNCSARMTGPALWTKFWPRSGKRRE
jgi:hypothetical protein